MDTKLVLTIIGSVLSIIGIVFISIPKVVNEKTMEQFPSEAVGISALLELLTEAWVSLRVGCNLL